MECESSRVKIVARGAALAVWETPRRPGPLSKRCCAPPPAAALRLLIAIGGGQPAAEAAGSGVEERAQEEQVGGQARGAEKKAGGEHGQHQRAGHAALGGVQGGPSAHKQVKGHVVHLQ